MLVVVVVGCCYFLLLWVVVVVVVVVIAVVGGGRGKCDVTFDIYDILIHVSMVSLSGMSLTGTIQTLDCCCCCWC